MSHTISQDGIFKYFTKLDLIHANNAAIRENRASQLNEEFLENLPEDYRYPIIFVFEHEREELRVQILFHDTVTTGLLDMSRLRYETLPETKIGEDGRAIIESEESIESKRPYPKEREWIVTTIRKPVRRQGDFRKSVLEAYENQCAVCSVNEKALLRAAHIIPVVESGDDSVNNGICLCIMHEVAYDRGILKITPEGKVEVLSDAVIKVEFTELRLPANPEYHPSPSNLGWRFKDK